MTNVTYLAEHRVARPVPCPPISPQTTPQTTPGPKPETRPSADALRAFVGLLDAAFADWADEHGQHLDEQALVNALADAQADQLARAQCIAHGANAADPDPDQTAVDTGMRVARRYFETRTMIRCAPAPGNGQPYSEG